MKVRIAKDLYADIQARAELLGCDVSAVCRRALSTSRRAGVADLLIPEVATRDGSTVATLDLGEELARDPLCTARIRWALYATRPNAVCAIDLECDPAAVVVREQEG